MAYVNKQNLSDFWTNAKRYIAARDADGCDWNSVPVNSNIFQFEAAPHTPVNPVVEFGFTETPPEEGEKGPDNPSTITGVDSITVTRCGKNLSGISETTSTSGVTFTSNNDGTYVANGTATSNIFFALLTKFAGDRIKVKKGELYSISGCPSGGSTTTYSTYLSLIDKNGTFISSAYDTGNGAVFTVPEDGMLGYYINIKQGTAVNNLTFKPCFELGSPATSFEPYSGTTATVNLGETRYGGTIDVATGKMTATWGSLTITFVNNFQGDNGTCVKFAHVDTREQYKHYTADYADYFVCESFPTIKIDTQSTEYTRAIGSGTNFSQSCLFSILKSRLDVSGAADPSAPTNAEWLAAINAWLTEHPITYYFKRYVPATIDLDPQQLFSALSNSKVNTVFTDTGTISQLTYAKPAPSQEDVFRYANWHRTETAGAVTCCPVPESELHPVVNFSFTETPPTDGEKGPDNPSTVTGVSKINLVHTGKNLFKQPYQTAPGSTIGTTTFTVDNATGAITANTPTSSSSNAPFWLVGNSANIRLVGGRTYCLSGCPSGGGENTYRLGCTIYSLKNEPTGLSYYDNGNGVAFTPATDCHIVATATVRAGATVSNLVFKPLLEEAEIATSFEPPLYKPFAISLPSTYYGGSIDLSTGLMTVTHYGIAFDGTENWADFQASGASGYYRMALINAAPRIKTPVASNALCSHYIINPSNDYNGYHATVYNASSTGANLYLYDVYTTLSSFKGFLASQYANGTPVTMVYSLETPSTVQLTPQQIKALPALDKYSYRVNTLYTDADSIQVGYMKSPIKTEEEFNNAILALGGNL